MFPPKGDGGGKGGRAQSSKQKIILFLIRQKKSIYIIRLIAPFYNVEVNSAACDSFCEVPNSAACDSLCEVPNQKVSDPPNHSTALSKPEGI